MAASSPASFDFASWLLSEPRLVTGSFEAGSRASVEMVEELNLLVSDSTELNRRCWVC